MKGSDNTTENLIKMSESIRDEITRDVFEMFGIDLPDQKPAHHAKTKPVWTQHIRDNKSIKKELDSFLDIVKNNLERAPAMIKFEREHPAIVASSSHDSISYDLEFLWICESHVDKFEKEQYLSARAISRYRQRIQKLRDMARDITAEQSLQSHGI